MGQLAAQGWEITAAPEKAEVLVVNTCSFIEAAQQESIDTILEMAEHKRSGQVRRLVVAGCLVERYREQIQREIPEVDALVGTNELTAILAACDPGGAPAVQPQPAASVLPVLPHTATAAFDERRAPYLYDELTPRLLATPRHSVYIKIAEGCDHPCSFCVIPSFRGAFRSRRFESVIAEAERLARQGAREVVLIGQDTTSYGEDLGLRDGLALLLERLAAIEELAWIRTLYFYPNRVTPRLLETIGRHARLCNYVDMPLQHASPAVLKRMRRGGTGEQFLKLVERVRAAIPGVAIRTTFIVGFPGETDEDFRELCDFVTAAELDWVGVFGYSDETNSRSHGLDGKVPRGEIERRRKQVMALQRGISRRRRQALVGRQLPVLVEGPAEESDLLWQGRLESQAPEIDGKVWINDCAGGMAPAVGELAQIEITEAHDYDLVGRIVAQ